ncbi:hypothetical protein PALB_35030 [Pseudoalteromonas luteoviolacea B = ATCC 29581]|nr:hypothetical protein PALB_35030 [Pseudoalteromonas luteoviolacea B = ATCC 29581]
MKCQEYLRGASHLLLASFAAFFVKLDLLFCTEKTYSVFHRRETLASMLL